MCGCRVDPGRNEPQALCTCPTRELVVQNLSVIQRMAKFTSIRVTSTALDGDRKQPITEQVGGAFFSVHLLVIVHARIMQTCTKLTHATWWPSFSFSVFVSDSALIIIGVITWGLESYRNYMTAMRHTSPVAPAIATQPLGVPHSQATPCAFPLLPSGRCGALTYSHHYR